jgi:predicted transcriptional regulator
MRLTIRLSGEAKRAVETIAKVRNAKISDVIRRAIGTELYLIEEQARGAKILIQDQEGTRQLVLR